VGKQFALLCAMEEKESREFFKKPKSENEEKPSKESGGQNRGKDLTKSKGKKSYRIEQLEKKEKAKQGLFLHKGGYPAEGHRQGGPEADTGGDFNAAKWR